MSRYLLGKKWCAEHAAKAEVTKCVLSIPYKASTAYKVEMLTAAAMAELDCIGLVQEPEAAYMGTTQDLHMSPNSCTDLKSLVFDLGASHLAVSVLDINCGQPSIIGHQEDDSIGGRYLDK